MTSNNRRGRKRDPFTETVTSEDIYPSDTNTALQETAHRDNDRFDQASASHTFSASWSQQLDSQVAENVYDVFGFLLYPSIPSAPYILSPSMIGVPRASYGVDTGTDPSEFPGGYMPVDCIPSGYDPSHATEGIENDGYVVLPGNYPNFGGVESFSTPINTFAREGGPSPEEAQQRGHDESFNDTDMFKCKWNGCTDPRTFQQTSDMVEHIETVHIQPNNFKCEWNGCVNRATFFKRKTDLIRHIETIDLEPKSFKCPEEGCDYACNRKDNLNSHIRRKH